MGDKGVPRPQSEKETLSLSESWHRDGPKLGRGYEQGAVRGERKMVSTSEKAQWELEKAYQNFFESILNIFTLKM